MKILIFGNGYIGNRCAEQWGDEAIVSDRIVVTKHDALDEIKKHQPDVVLNAAGIKGRPNVDWCENNQLITIQGNTIMPLLLAQACNEAGVYMLHMGSGCIFYGDSLHADKAWKEGDFGNPGAVYSRTKWSADLCLSTLDDVGIARIRMPIDWKPSEGNLINKLAGYKKVIDVENSVTIIDDMIDVFYQLLKKQAPGIFHVTNPGLMKHKDLISLYIKYVDADHSCEWITEEDLVSDGIAKKARSNNALSNTRLAQYGIKMRPVNEALLDTIKKYAEAKRTERN